MINDNGRGLSVRSFINNSLIVGHFVVRSLEEIILFYFVLTGLKYSIFQNSSLGKILFSKT